MSLKIYERSLLPAVFAKTLLTFRHYRCKLDFSNKVFRGVAVHYFHKMANFIEDPGTFDEFMEKLMEGRG